MNTIDRRSLLKAVAGGVATIVLPWREPVPQPDEEWFPHIAWDADRSGGKLIEFDWLWCARETDSGKEYAAVRYRIDDRPWVTLRGAPPLVNPRDGIAFSVSRQSDRFDDYLVQSSETEIGDQPHVDLPWKIDLPQTTWLSYDGFLG